MTMAELDYDVAVVKHREAHILEAKANLTLLAASHALEAALAKWIRAIKDDN